MSLTTIGGQTARPGPVNAEDEARRNLDSFRRSRLWQQAAPGLDRPIDRLHGAQTVLACGFTSRLNVAVPFRPQIVATRENGLDQPSSIMIEKLAAVSRTKLSERVGVLTEDDMERVEQALQLVLGFAG